MLPAPCPPFLHSFPPLSCVWEGCWWRGEEAGIVDEGVPMPHFILHHCRMFDVLQALQVPQEERLLP
ncbi:unnamed protein product [Victoria cruziana]